ncbi:MAG: DoxX protein [Bacteroidota bacterium]
MKLIKNIPVYLLTLIYLVFGANYFLHFLTMPPMAGNAGNFVGVLFSTNFLLVVKILEISLSLLILVPKTRALGLVLIAPISINILLFELLIAHQPGIGILMVLLNAIAISQYKNKYLGMVNNRLVLGKA